MPRNPNKIDYSGGFPPFFNSFSSLSDPRTGGNTLHHFGSIIFMTYTCIICGVSKYDLMEEFCDANEAWFASKEGITYMGPKPACRSTSVGDYVLIGTKKYECKPCGWEIVK